MARSGAEASGRPREIASSTPGPKLRRRSRQSSLPESRHGPRGTRRSPAGPPRGSTRVPQPKPRTSRALRPHPPRWADVRARRNLTEQPTSRRCSADESVVTSRRCQRPVTRSFHGLCVPLQGPARSAPARRCRAGRRAAPEPRLGAGAPDRPPWRRAVAVSGHWDPSVGSPCSIVAEAVLETGARGGRSRVSLRCLFSTGARAP